jgi:DNA-binding response OmpR family regulator
LSSDLCEALARFRVLVLDDEPDVALAIREIIELRGHMVVTVYDLEAAWRSIVDWTPDVLVADLNISGVPSTRLLQVVRDLFASVRRVLISASPRSDWIALVESGLVQAALAKPFESQELVRAIEEWTHG